MKYGNSGKIEKGGTAEQEAICELVRQRNHLEISLTSVKRKLAKDADFSRAEQLKILHVSISPYFHTYFYVNFVCTFNGRISLGRKICCLYTR